MKTKNIVRVSLATALIAVCSWISVPFTIPFTLQTFAVCAVAGLLGTKLGLISVVLYILLGFLGLPVFAGFNSGPAAILGSTGGYIVGFIVQALITGLVADRTDNSFKLGGAMVLGLIGCYLLGTLWFTSVYVGDNGPVSFVTALSMCVLPYIIPDLLKIVLAVFTVKRIKPHINK